jgi:uncharacterized membrane protein
MTSAEIALALFTLCNSVRVFAYVPQIIAVARDPGGASASSLTTWGLFAVSHLSTVGYAVLVAEDWRMAALFVANALCCVIILGLTAWKRALFRAAQTLLANTRHSVHHDPGAPVQVQETAAVQPPGGARPAYRVLAGGKDRSVHPV